MSNCCDGMRVDKEGRVWSMKTGKECSYSTDENGYKVVTMRNPGEKRVIRRMATILAKAQGIEFIQGRDKAEVKDGKVIVTRAPRKRKKLKSGKKKSKVFYGERPSTWMNGDDELYA